MLRAYRAALLSGGVAVLLCVLARPAVAEEPTSQSQWVPVNYSSGLQTTYMEVPARGRADGADDMLNSPTDPSTQCSGFWVPGYWGCYRGVRVGPNCEVPFGSVPAGWRRPPNCHGAVDGAPSGSDPSDPADGAPTAPRPIQPIVDPQAPAEYQCEGVQVNAPAQLQPGEDAWVEVTMTNRGSVAWPKPTVAGYDGVYIQIPSDVRQTVDWGDDWENWHVKNRKMPIPHEVAAGETITVRVPIKAPTDGTYTFQTQLYVNSLSSLMDDRPYGAFCRSETTTITVGNPADTDACEPGDFLLDRDAIVRDRGNARLYGGTARYIAPSETQTFCAVVDEDISGQGLSFYAGPGFYMWDDQGTQRKITIIPPANSGLQINEQTSNNMSHIYQANQAFGGKPVPVPNPPQGRYRIIVEQVGEMMTQADIDAWILSLPVELRDQYRGYTPGGYVVGWMGPSGNWAN